MASIVLAKWYLGHNKFAKLNVGNAYSQDFQIDGSILCIFRLRKKVNLIPTNIIQLPQPPVSVGIATHVNSSFQQLHYTNRMTHHNRAQQTPIVIYNPRKIAILSLFDFYCNIYIYIILFSFPINVVVVQ